MSKQNYTRKYFMMGSQDVPAGKSAGDILEEAIKGGITAFEYRELGEDQLFGLDKINLATELRRICKQHNIPFIVNNDIEMLKLMNADGIRLKENNSDLRNLRKQLPNKIIGLTISSERQEDGGEMVLADFIAAGPVYESLPHIEKQNPIGVGLIKQLSTVYPTIKVVAFGGINETNADEVTDAGGGIGVISAITEAESIQDVVSKL